VEFFQGATKLGEALSTPYSFAWQVCPWKLHFNGKATDNAGAITVSAGIPIVVSDPATAFQLGLYAPDAILMGSMTLTTDPTASKGSYFQCPGNGKNYYIPHQRVRNSIFNCQKAIRICWAR